MIKEVIDIIVKTAIGFLLKDSDDKLVKDVGSRNYRDNRQRELPEADACSRRRDASLMGELAN